LLILGLTLAGCGGTATPSATTSAAAKPASGRASIATIRFGINGQVPSSSYIWLMGDAGLFKKNGLPVELRGMTGQAQTNAMVAGDIDAEVHAGIALVLSAAAQGTPLKIVGVMQHVYDLQMLVPNSITSPEQLKGKKIGSQTTTSANSMATRQYLGQHGLQLDRDYSLIVTGAAGSEAGMVAQLLGKQVDAIAVTQSAADQVLAQGGYHVLVDFTKTDVRVASQALVLQASFVKQQPDVTQRLVDTMIEGVRYFREHKPEALEVMRTRFKLTDEAAANALFERQVQVLSKTPTVAKADFADVLASMPKDQPQLSDAQLDEMLDNRYVEDAVKRGLTNY